MAKQKLTYTFVDPNGPGDLERMLMYILIRMLRSVSGENGSEGE